MRVAFVAALFASLAVIGAGGVHAANNRIGRSLRAAAPASAVAQDGDGAVPRRLACTSCAFGEYEVAPCAGGNDTTPVCAACSLGCPAGTQLITPCSLTADRVCVPDAHADCARKAVTLTTTKLEEITQDKCANCATYVSHINTALQEGYMACPLRIAAFIAQTRHATDGFKFLKASNNGAGAIHLQPSNFETACNQIPELKQAFTNELGGCSSSSGSESQRADIIARPQFAFRVAVWWFTTGSSIMLDPVCGDLRFDSDCGLGGAPFFTTTQSPGEGFQKVTTCVGGFGVEPGRQQRADYYVAARAGFTEQDPEVCGDPLNAASSAAVAPLAVALAAVAAVLAAFIQ